MREILFRGKRIDKSEWVYGSYCYAELLDKSGYEHLIIEQSAEGKSHNVVAESVGQYTGLTDKNGTRIFEGDIVKCSDIDDYYYPEEKTEFVGTIVFESGAFGIATKDTLRISLENWCENDNFVSLWELEWNEYIYNVEVIGNIHDNPELMK